MNRSTKKSCFVFFLAALIFCLPHAWAQPQEGSPEITVPAAAGDVPQGKKSTILDTLEIKDMDINDVLKLLAAKSGLNIIAGKSVTGRVTIFLQNVDVRDALTIILKANDLAYMENHGVVQIMTGIEYELATGHKFGVGLENTIISLQSAKASNVAAILNQVKSQSGLVIADDQSNSLIIQDVPEKMEQMLRYVRTIDAPTRTLVYKLKHIAGDPLVAKLQDMISTKIGSVRFDSFSNKLFIKDTPLKLAEITKYLNQIDIPRETKVFHINYAKADELSKTLGPMLTKDVGSIEYDARSNTLVLMDIPPKIDEISTMIAALDRDDKEVFIEARIVQIALGDQYQMGVNWDKVLPHIANTALNFSSSFPVAGSPTSDVGTMSVGTISGGSFNDVIQALDNFGKSQTLSNPRLAVINNQEASILIGTTVPYTTTTGTTNSVGTTNTESVNFIDVGVKLHVTPTIHDDGFITMKIKPEISNEEPTPFTAPDGSVIPIVDTSEVQTTVRIKDGVTIIIGGLIKDVYANNKNKLPVLGDLPLVGKAFSNVDRNMQKTEIVIFLTPHIINGDLYTDPQAYLKETSTLKGTKTYYDPFPKDESTVPVP